MSGPSEWETRTHVWAHPVDTDHLAEVRSCTPPSALHAVLEVLAYADEEAASRGARGSVVVTLGDEAVTVDDDGRGTETRLDAAGRVIRKPVMSTRDVRFFDKIDAALLPDGLPRRGMSSVAAHAERLVHTNHRGGRSWSQEYRHGVPEDELVAVASRGRPGTVVGFSHPGLASLDASTLAEAAAGFAHLGVEILDRR